MLTERELARYDRQIMIPEIGENGQERLKGSKVLVAGAGGLGSAVCPYLAAAGVGAIRIVDHDRVALSNLNRQVLHWQSDVGERKVDSAVKGPDGDHLKNHNHTHLKNEGEIKAPLIPNYYLVAIDILMPFLNESGSSR